VRTFVAAWPDEQTRQRLTALELGLGHEKNLRLVGPTRWHVTLRFLGEVTEAELGPLGHALQTAMAAVGRPLPCRLGPATAWFSRVRILQLPAQGLDTLAAAVGRATAPIVAPQAGDGLAFNGHLTLARVKGRLGPQAQAELEGIPCASTFSVEHVDLVASEPSPRGHVYTTLLRAPLGTGLLGTG
jgi:RNA 2',3'-cyclic 3'-phosphodiesterase